MDYIKQLIDFILHIDKHLLDLTAQYNDFTYIIIFGIIFCETGLVIMPLLPGDSLLFAAGAICATGALKIEILAPGIFLAAMLGDNVNYFVGKFVGGKLTDSNSKVINKKYLNQTEAFFEKHGGKAIIFARFVPIVRTFAPFVAGAGQMNYGRFILFCLVANSLWVGIFCTAGYVFANNEFVKHNFSLVILGVIFASLLPILFALVKSKMSKKNTV